MKYCLLLFLLIGFFEISSAQQIPNLPIPLGAGTVEVWHNQIFHFGGSNNWSGTIVYPRIYRYDGVTWSYHDSIPDNNLWDVESVLVGDDAYLISGWPSGSELLRKYNMNSNNWTYLANSPNTSQTWGITAEHLNGKIYLFLSDGTGYKYTIATDTWEAITSNSATGTWDLSSILFQNEIYILGYNDSTFYKYTPATDSWTQLSDSPYQVGACAMGIIDDLIYCVGGNLNGSTSATYRSVIVYDITTDGWAIDSLQISSRRHWMATAEYRGGLYVVGGIDSLSQAVDIVEEIVPQGTATGIADLGEVTTTYLLKQNYPNPFNPATTILYELPQASNVVLKIYNTLGQEVITLVNERQGAGEKSVVWNGRDRFGKQLGSGVYIYKLEASDAFATAGNGFVQSRKMLLLK